MKAALEERYVDEQGRKANENGKKLERVVEELILSYGVRAYKYSKINNRFAQNVAKQINPNGFLLKNVPYTNMYGGNSRGEFVLKLNGRDPIRIECRSQYTHGSVDEKLPYLFGNCIAFDEKDVVVVIDGDGMRREAVNYLRNIAKSGFMYGKTIRVFTPTEFQRWLSSIMKPF